MDSRKVQVLGPSTLAVTLPIDWAREHDVDKGTDLAYRITDDTIAFYAASEEGGRETTIDASESEDLEMDFKTAYVLGFKRITVTELIDDHHDLLNELESSLHAAQLIGQTDTSRTFDISVDPMTASIGETLQRIASASLNDNDQLAHRLVLLADRLTQQLLTDDSLRREAGIQSPMMVVAINRCAHSLAEIATDTTWTDEDITDAIVAAIGGDVATLQDRDGPSATKIDDQLRTIAHLASFD